MSQDSKKKKFAKEFANLTLELTRVDGARRVVRRRAVGQERRALDLLDVVEASDADKAIREHLGAHLDLSDDLFRVGAAVHRELPHDPVTVVIVAGVDGGVQTRPAVAVSVGVFAIFKLDARSPAVVQQVLDLLGHFGIGERRQEGESLEHLVAVRAPDHHGLGVGDLAGGDGDGLGDLRGGLGDSGHLSV